MGVGEGSSQSRKEKSVASNKSRAIVPGSEKKALPNAKAAGRIDPDQTIEIGVMLRPRRSGGSKANGQAAAKSAMSQGTQLPEGRSYVAREAFAAERGADAGEMAKVETFAQQHHLTIVEASLPKRTLRL